MWPNKQMDNLASTAFIRVFYESTLHIEKLYINVKEHETHENRWERVNGGKEQHVGSQWKEAF